MVSYGEDQGEIERHQFEFRREDKIDLGKLIQRQRDPGGERTEAAIEQGSHFGNVHLTRIPTAVSVRVECSGEGSRSIEVARQRVEWPHLEAAAVARADPQINPVDLGTILVPHDWLVLGRDQTAIIDIAAISRSRDIPGARLKVGFDGGTSEEHSFSLPRNTRVTKRLHLNLPKGEWRDSSSISVSILDQEQEIWRENRRVMIIHKALHIPTFAAVETKLRYDAPISVKNRGQAKYTSIDYSTAWDERLNDVVVFLPNGSRFVFWRGSSYIPFWAGKLNTGINYQWLEGGVVRKDAVDAVEPLQDKELRYSRVRVVESTPSRIHVRWTYQATDFAYKVWGDHATEDFYFYPDGFGTRVLTAVSEPEANYQVTEFIVVVPQAAYPLEILPARPIEMLYLNGEKISLSFPDPLPLAAERGSEVLRHLMKQWVGPPPYPAVYRIFDHKDDPTSAVYFSPRDLPRVLSVFKPFYDEGSLVVPAYWGDHWPLGRGALTGGSISDRIYSSPSHISLMGGLEREETTPLFTRELRMLDALGHSRLMKVRRWAWLIGRTNASDDELRSMAVSFSSPPSIRVSGGRIAFPSHTYERRSIRLVVDKPNVTIYVEPSGRTVNPVFELEDAPKRLEGVVIDGSPVGPSDYAWDGSTLWIRGSLSKTTRIDLNFAAKSDPEGGTTSAKPHEASSNLKSRQIASYD